MLLLIYVHVRAHILGESGKLWNSMFAGRRERGGGDRASEERGGQCIRPHGSFRTSGLLPCPSPKSCFAKRFLAVLEVPCDVGKCGLREALR